jgi:hypothetical protein
MFMLESEGGASWLIEMSSRFSNRSKLFCEHVHCVMVPVDVLKSLAKDHDMLCLVNESINLHLILLPSILFGYKSFVPT